MSDSILQVNQIKDKGGNATGITVADTTANVTIGNLTASSGNLGTITQRSTSNISGITFSESGGGTVNTTNLFGSTNVTLHGSVTTHAWLKFSYTTAVKINKLQWFQNDGAGGGGTLNTSLTFEGSNVASPNSGAGHSDWTILKTFSTPLTNDETLSYSGASNAIKYKHYRIRYGWASSGNYCSIHSFVLEDTDSTFDIRAPLNAIGTAPTYACRAWVNFDGNATAVTIRSSGNVSSITDNATGNYTINFTNAMPDANYAAVCSAGNSGSTWPRIIGAGTNSSSAYSTSQVGLYIINPNDRTPNDQDRVQVAVFR